MTEWTPEQFWQFVGGLAGQFEAEQIRDTLQLHGLSLVKAAEHARCSEQIAARQKTSRDCYEIEGCPHWVEACTRYQRAEARLAEAVKALEILLDEATSFSVSGVYFDEECMGHKGPALARSILASVSGSAEGGK